MKTINYIHYAETARGFSYEVYYTDGTKTKVYNRETKAIVSFIRTAKCKDYRGSHIHYSND